MVIAGVTNSVARLRAAMLEIELQVVDEGRMPVAGEEHRIPQVGVNDVLQQMFTGERTTVPGVVPRTSRVGWSH